MDDSAFTIFSPTEGFAMAAFLEKSPGTREKAFPTEMKLDRAGNLYLTGP